MNIFRNILFFLSWQGIEGFWFWQWAAWRLTQITFISLFHNFPVFYERQRLLLMQVLLYKGDVSILCNLFPITKQKQHDMTFMSSWNWCTAVIFWGSWTNCPWKCDPIKSAGYGSPLTAPIWQWNQWGGYELTPSFSPGWTSELWPESYAQKTVPQIKSDKAIRSRCWIQLANT